jgi:hypothetical protein
MEISGKLHVPADLNPGNHTLLPILYAAEWATVGVHSTEELALLRIEPQNII